MSAEQQKDTREQSPGAKRWTYLQSIISLAEQVTIGKLKPDKNNKKRIIKTRTHFSKVSQIRKETKKENKVQNKKNKILTVGAYAIYSTICP